MCNDLLNPLRFCSSLQVSVLCSAMFRAVQTGQVVIRFARTLISSHSSRGTPMKKSVFFVAALALALTACGDNNKAAADAKAAADKAAAPRRKLPTRPRPPPRMPPPHRSKQATPPPMPPRPMQPRRSRRVGRRRQGCSHEGAACARDARRSAPRNSSARQGKAGPRAGFLFAGRLRPTRSARASPR